MPTQPPVQSQSQGYQYQDYYVPLTTYDAVVTRHLFPMVNTLSRVVYSIPQNVYSTTLDLTNAVAGKLQELGDAYTGKGSSDTGNDFVQISKRNYDYLEKVRKNNPKKFKEFELLTKIYNDSTPDKQQLIVKTYFQVQTKTI